MPVPAEASSFRQGTSVGVSTPDANIFAMIDVVKEFGQYPLNMDAIAQGNQKIGKDIDESVSGNETPIEYKEVKSMWLSLSENTSGARYIVDSKWPTVPYVWHGKMSVSCN